jgi:hypothetical protein
VYAHVMRSLTTSSAGDHFCLTASDVNILLICFYPTLPASRLYPRMRASSFRHLRWVAIPVRSPWSRPLGRAHPFCHVLHSTKSLTPQHRCFSASRTIRLIREGDSTIYALSTAPGRAAIAVVRVSGPDCVSVCGIVLA